jgi:hypothetical protein
MTIREIYRLAVCEGLTAVEAGQKYGCKSISLHKIGSKYKLPKLKTEFRKKIDEQIKGMNDVQLEAYWNAIQLPKNAKTGYQEREAVQEEIARRKANVIQGSN